MQFLTKHFGFSLHRSIWPSPAPWARFVLTIGLFDKDEQPHGTAYRYAICVHFQLLPNFVWWRTFITEERGHKVYQDRIIGIQNWPFSFYVMR